MRARVCATVTGRTTAELRVRRDAAVAAGADLVELRLDHVEDPDAPGALAGRTAPVVVTCRPPREGGRFRGAEAERRTLLEQALDLGAEYVDLEWRAGFDDLIRRRRGRNVVLSLHDFDRAPGDLADRYRAMRATGAEMVKVAVRVRSLTEALALPDVGAGDPGRVIVAMGPSGVVSRILPDRFGSAWTYAGEGVAPGQVGLSRLLDEFRVREVSDSTALYGVLGAPVSRSASPAMHNAGFAAVGRDAVYLPLEAADVDDFRTFAEKTGLRGASVTAPFKEAAAPLLAEADPLVRRIGAVNTVRIAGDGWEGINTDVPGLLEPLAGRIALAGCRAAVIGAGGAARAAAVALAGEGAQVTVRARNPERAAGVAKLVGGTAGRLPPPPGSWDLLVNATPAGAAPDVDGSPLPDGPFDGQLVYDLVYDPPTTRLMADAAAAGCAAIGGLPMLVAQAVRQFAWWTGAAAPPGLFAAAAQRRLAAAEPREAAG